ncbi:proteolipid protein 2, partial [Siphateles boraxobius]|uniref:proteolipid protein 2 n=1 Tax=Siphateles boraxobius TaxID=180520 RepID=UPI004062AAE1
IRLCLIVIICKAVSLGCYLWSPIIELVWAIIIFIVYGMDLEIQLFPWTDFFRAITGSLILFITSLVCISWAWDISGEAIFGLMAAAVLGYDAFSIIKYIKELKEQGRAM